MLTTSLGSPNRVKLTIATTEIYTLSLHDAVTISFRT